MYHSYLTYFETTINQIFFAYRYALPNELATLSPLLHLARTMECSPGTIPAPHGVFSKMILGSHPFKFQMASCLLVFKRDRDQFLTFPSLAKQPYRVPTCMAASVAIIANAVLNLNSLSYSILN